ncbi:MAG TPA: hypothetical protein VGC89_20135 [Pyrinomonadaceae bacterium]
MADLTPGAFVSLTGYHSIERDEARARPFNLSAPDNVKAPPDSRPPDVAGPA